MKFNVLALGEILWDLLPSGAQPGGAPANFAYHAQALGARAGVVTRVGNDRLGRDLQDHLAAMNLPLDLVQVDETVPTGTVTVELTGDGIPHFTIHEQVAWDQLQPTEAARLAARSADAICFGSLAQRGPVSRAAIQQLLRLTDVRCLRIFDINLRQHYYSREVIEQSLELANVLKLNETELPVLESMMGLTGSAEAQLAMLADRYGLEVIALTRGAAGSLLYQQGRISECQSRPVQVKDTVGAGDSFTAALVMGLLQGVDLDVVHRAASEVARYVCSCEGATPPLPTELRELIR
jgi:fructokinase